MQIGRVKGCARVLGKQQGYLGLPVRDELIDNRVAGQVNAMTTAWLPTPKEIQAINAGAPVHVRIFGTGHPPIMVEVGEVPE